MTRHVLATRSRRSRPYGAGSTAGPTRWCSPDSRWDRLERPHQVALLAAAAAFVGSLGPWFSPFGINTYGFETNGILVAIPTFVGLFALLFLDNPTSRNTTAAVALGMAAAIGAYSFVFAPHRIMSWGLPLATIGSIVACAGAIVGRNATTRLVPASARAPQT